MTHAPTGDVQAPERPRQDSQILPPRFARRPDSGVLQRTLGPARPPWAREYPTVILDG